ncbi:MFS transporter [bacterium BMS3Abin03]|nr:MFS transporter [bacterium BMS3Abin03]
MSTKLYLNNNLQVIFSITLMSVLGVASITPAFPKIENELNISEQEVGLLITVFTLPGVILTPILGVLADRYGRKQILIPSLILFAIAGTSCFFTRHFDLLLVFRLLQGIGAASLGSLNVTLIGDFFNGRDRASAMGYNASVLSIGTASYPAIGGALATIGWHFPFLLPSLAVPIALIALYSLKSSKPANNQNIKEYLSKAWKAVKDKRVIGIFIASIFTFIILYGSYLTFFPFLLDSDYSASPLIIGLLMSTMSLTTAITSSQLGSLSVKYSQKVLLKIAFIIYALSMILIPLIPHLWLMIIPLIFFGIAQGLNIPSLQTMLTNLAPAENRAAFMSLNGMVLRLGQTIGPLIMGFVFVLSGMTGVFFAGAAFALLMFVLILIMIN